MNIYDYTVPAADGSTVSLKDYEGKVRISKRSIMTIMKKGLRLSISRATSLPVRLRGLMKRFISSAP